MVSVKIPSFVLKCVCFFFQVLRADVVDQDPQALRDRRRGLLGGVGGLLLPGLRLLELLLEPSGFSRKPAQVRPFEGECARQYPLLAAVRFCMGELIIERATK